LDIVCSENQNKKLALTEALSRPCHIPVPDWHPSKAGFKTQGLEIFWISELLGRAPSSLYFMLSRALSLILYTE
jgi:hypothetical protein